jgi:hypothetical protein
VSDGSIVRVSGLRVSGGSFVRVSGLRECPVAVSIRLQNIVWSLVAHFFNQA